MTELLTLADIVGVYGIKGWVKVRVYLESPQTLANFEDIKLVPGPKLRAGTAKAAVVDAVRAQGKGTIAHIKGIDSRTEAEALVGFVLQVASDQLPTPEAGEYYWRDLVGLKVFCREGERVALIGTVDHLLDTGANDVVVVRPCEGSVDDSERLIPWLPEENVELVDLVAGELRFDWFIEE